MLKRIVKFKSYFDSRSDKTNFFKTNWSFQYSLCSDVVGYVPVGCYMDKTSYRALPKMLANYRVQNGKWPDVLDWNDLENSVIKRCAAKVYLLFF